MSPDYLSLARALLPELALVLGAFLVIGFDLIFGKRHTLDERMRASVSLAAVAIVAAAFQVVSVGRVGPVFGQVLMLDMLGWLSRLGVLGLAFFTLSLAPASPRLRHPAEFVALILFATAGFTLMAVAQQLLIVFLAVELASLSLYLLAGYDKTRPESAEAALKYFLFGGMSAAFLLFGFSLLYGLTGSIELPLIAAALSSGASSPLLSVALVMVLVAFGFKAAAAPFHLWAPDVYQGAPTPSAALIASASKLAGLTVFARLLWPGLGGAAGGYTSAAHTTGWLTPLALIAGASFVLGNLGALAQTNVRRLLAYSAIAHAGVMLLGVMVVGDAGFGPVVYYGITYGLATIGAFGVVGILEREGTGPLLTDLVGLHRRSPLMGGCLLIYLLSLAGVPPLAGFYGKFSIFLAAFHVDGVAAPVAWLALLGLAASAVGLYYYLVILKNALINVPTADQPAAPIKLNADVAFGLILLAALLLGLGLFPSVIVGNL